MSDTPITLGVEEEFFLVDPDSRDLVADPPLALTGRGHRWTIHFHLSWRGTAARAAERHQP